MRGSFLLAAVAACALLGTTSAFAQSATQDINISATVTKACTIGNAVSGTPGSATIPILASGAVDTSPITPTGSPFANVACNAPSNLQLSSTGGGVVNATPAAGGFTNVIDYTASATWNGTTANIDTRTVATAIGLETGPLSALASASSGDLTVTINPVANALPLMMGGYSDTLRVTLTPQ